MSQKKKINDFLERVRENIACGKFDFINRDRRDLTRLGIAFADAINIVKHLQIKHYYRGPTKDHNNKGNEIYEFGYPLEDLELYIKLTFRAKDDLFIMSFHEAQRPIVYKYDK